MSDGANRPIDPHDLVDPSRFRNAAAGIIRDLLSAVKLESPTILTDEIWQQWWDDKNQPAQRSAEYFLRLAAANRRKFLEEFAGYLDSVPVLALEDGPAVEDYIERLRELVLLFAVPDELEEAARQIKTHKPVDWKKLCVWESLPELRSLLNKLPPTQARPNADNARSITEITDVFDTPIGGVLVYNNLRIEKVRDKVWLLLNRLLKCRYYTAQFDSLCEPIRRTDGSLLAPVWEVEPRDKDKSAGWGRLTTLLRETRKLFRANGISWTVSESKELRTVSLKSLPLGDNGRSRQKSSAAKTPKPAKQKRRPKKAK